MATSVFQALNNAVRAGGTGLSARDIAGGRGVAVLLDRLCADGLLTRVNGKPPKYDLTPAGRAAWEREANANRPREAERKMSESVPAASVGIQRVQQDVARLVALLEELRGLVEQQRRQIDALEERLSERLDNLARRVSKGEEVLSTTDEAVPTPGEVGAPALDLDFVWEVTQSEYEKLRGEADRKNKAVNVPELTDAVRFSFPALSAPDFHALLVEWQRANRLSLRPCPDPAREPRAAEGIATDEALLFYVTLGPAENPMPPASQ